MHRRQAVAVRARAHRHEEALRRGVEGGRVRHGLEVAVAEGAKLLEGAAARQLRGEYKVVVVLRRLVQREPREEEPPVRGVVHQRLAA